MPFYIISSQFYIEKKNFKFEYSPKSENEYLKEYKVQDNIFLENIFILKKWNNEGNIKKEQKIHDVLYNIDKLEYIENKWYKCYDLLYLLLIIDGILYYMYDENNENKSTLKFISNEIDNGIKKYVDSINDDFFDNIAVNINNIRINNIISIVKKKHVEIEMESYYIPKNGIEIIIKNFINKNDELIYGPIKEYINQIYFTKKIDIYNFNILIKYKDKYIELSINNYIKYIKKILKIVSGEIKIYLKIYYYLDVVLLNNYKKTEKELLKLRNVLTDNIYDDIYLYLDNKILKTKKYNIYKLLENKKS